MQTTERAHGLILRTRPFTETSLIVNWLTPDFGRIRSTLRKPIIVDGRNLYATAKMAELGFKYHSIGRLGAA